jgi:nickel superoxide dismutase
MIAEHITTIEKAMKQVTALSKKDESNYNQIVRWIQNKEKHAEELSDIVSYYFMAQRLKTVDRKDREASERYIKKLTLLHEMLIYAMKAKQTTDTAHVDKLRSLLGDFKVAYFGPKPVDEK